MAHHPATDASKQASIWQGWEELAHKTLVGAMKTHGVGYKALSRELEKLGIYESPSQLNRKVNRKRFSAAFLLASLKAIDASVPVCLPRLVEDETQ